MEKVANPYRYHVSFDDLPNLKLGPLAALYARNALLDPVAHRG